VRIKGRDIHWGRLAATLAAAAIVAGAAGCGDSNDESAGASTTATTTTQTTAPAQSKKKAAPKKHVPASLGTVESGAEDAIDFARAGDRAGVVRAARKLRRAADGKAAADLRKADVPEIEIADLQDRARLVASIARRAELLRVSLAANQVSALMPQFYARYADKVPPSVLELDYLDREAQLRSEAGAQPDVRAAVRKLSSTWGRLRAQVIAAHGRKAARDFTRHVAAMRRLARGGDAAALQHEAATGLELVDVLEGVFRRQ
jgi:hypothetical protein